MKPNLPTTETLSAGETTKLPGEVGAVAAGGILELVADYVGQGLAIFPCRGKTPLIPGGFKSASKDPAQVRKWWTQWPTANIGMATGVVSGFSILDVDVKDGVNGWDHLRELEAKNGALPTTRQVRTPRGGAHLWFAHTTGWTCTTGKLGPCLDTRGDGGYVIIPPSKGLNGGAYEWVDGAAPFAEAPAWLLEGIAKHKAAPEVNTTKPTHKPPPEDIEKALTFVSPNCDYQQWLEIGMGLHAWDDAQGLALWDAWSRPGKAYQEGVCEEKWAGFSPADGITIKTLFGLAKAAGLDLRTLTSARNGKGGGRPPFDADAATKDFISSCGIELRHHLGRWLRFAPAQGWRETSEDSLGAEVLTWLAGSAMWKPHAYSRSAREVVEQLKRFDLCGIPETVEAPCWLERTADGWKATPCPDAIACRRDDGAFEVVDITETARAIAEDRPLPETRPADASFFSLEWVPYRFDMGAACPKCQAYLNDALDLSEQVLVTDFLGLCLTSTTKYEVFLYFFGRSGREGKTVFLEILKALLGRPDAVSYVDIAKLSDRFTAWPLAHSKVNIAGDMNSIEYGELRKIEGVFKDLVSGGSFEYERKNEQKRVAKCKARFIFAGNSLPEFMDRSDAIWERLRIAEFPRQVPAEKRDPDLARKIIDTELPGVLAMAIRGLADIFARRGVVDTERGKELKQELRRVGDHEAAFLEEHGYCRGVGDLTTQTMFQEYRQWAEDNGYRPLGQGKFSGRIRDLLRVELATTKDNTRKTVRVFRGVARA